MRGYEGYYQVSNFGNVRSLDRIIYGNNMSKYAIKGKEKIPKMRNNGYLFVALYKNGKCSQLNIHRLVAEAFIDNVNNYPIVNHKDENKTNNNVNNLEWCTYSYNSTYKNARNNVERAHYKPVEQIDSSGKIINTYHSITEAAVSIGNINRRHNIGRICNGHGLTAYGYKWRYKEDKDE